MPGMIDRRLAHRPFIVLVKSDVKIFASLDAVHAGYTSQKPLDRAPTIHFTMNLIHDAVFERHI
jgi:hypothetical protein